MRRKISLYIADQLVDLDDQSFVLMNYTMDDLSNPTVVKNSFSQQITLKGTPANNKIFGGMWRSDRLAGQGGSGAEFNPAAKIPFAAYDEMGEILESGYCRLDEVGNKSGLVDYKVSLYGGLGAFLYGLSYNEDGSKRTLADLKYTGENAGDDEFDFVINAETVSEAWLRVTGHSGEALEYATEYDGMLIYTDGSLHTYSGTHVLEYQVRGYRKLLVSGRTGVAPTCLAVAFDSSGVALQAWCVGGSRVYTNYEIRLPSGAAILRVMGFRTGAGSVKVTTAAASPKWDILNFAPCHDGLPEGSFDAGKAIVQTSSAGLRVPSGYSSNNGFVLCDLAREYTCLEAHDLRSYLQRPVISLKSVIQALADQGNNGGYTVDLDSSFFAADNPYYEKAWMTLPLLNTLDLQVSEDSGTLTPIIGEAYIPGGGNLSTSYKIHLEMQPSIRVVDSPGTTLYLHCTEQGATVMTYIEFTCKAYDANNVLLSSFTTYVGTVQPDTSTIPHIDIVGRFKGDGSWLGDPVVFDIEQQGLQKIEITWNFVATWFGDQPSHTPSTTEAFSNTTSFASAVAIAAYTLDTDGLENTWRSTTSATARSGVTITKRMLLSSDKTPADYLLSYCKLFGLVLECDKARKVISVMQRRSFFDGATIDLTRRIDIGQRIKTVPLAYDAKWYDFKLPYEEGEFARYYKNIYGRVFGSQRINTGYQFNAEAKDLLDGIAFRGAVESLESSKCFCDILNGAYRIPSVFLDGGTYSLRNDAGETVDFPLGVPVTSVLTWWNNTHKTYDLFSKPQFHNAGNAAYEERDTLLFFQGAVSVSARMAVTDDNSVMLALNNNTPCWYLEAQDGDGWQVRSMPQFSRYYLEDGVVVASWDFGIPAEIPIPDISFGEGSTIYERFWRMYVSDRYDDDSRVMTCKVNLSGLQVGNDLLRHFYYFDGAVWSLNRIINHSLTTFGDTECEFVKVQDITNYMN